jgi:hypothetical protein
MLGEELLSPMGKVSGVGGFYATIGFVFEEFIRGKIPADFTGVPFGFGDGYILFGNRLDI